MLGATRAPVVTLLGGAVTTWPLTAPTRQAAIPPSLRILADEVIE